MILDDCYIALGLHPKQTYTASQFRKAYLARAKQIHPDVNPQDPTATQSFQHLTQCYETLLQCRTQQSDDKDDIHDSPTDVEYSVDDYKMMFEQWSSRASYLWNTSTEAKLMKQIWGHLSHYASTTQQTTTSPVKEKFKESFETLDSPNTPTTKPHNIIHTNVSSKVEHANNPELNLHFKLQLPLEDIYHMHTQKLSYQRQEWDTVLHQKNTHTHCLLIHTTYQNIVFYNEGHQCSQTLERGNVRVCIEPQFPEGFYIDNETQLLHIVLNVPTTKVGAIQIIDIFGEELFLTLTDHKKKYCFPKHGLYDVDTNERSDLMVNVQWV